MPLEYGSGAGNRKIGREKGKSRGFFYIIYDRGDERGTTDLFYIV